MKLCLVLLFIEKHNKQKKRKEVGSYIWDHPLGRVFLPGLSAAISFQPSKINGVKYVMYPYVCMYVQ